MKTRPTLTKLLPALTLASILSFCATIGADAGQVIHFNTSGDFANVDYSIFDPNTTAFYHVNAQRSGAATGLFIFGDSLDQTTGTVTELLGFGSVPGTALSFTA